MKAKLRHFWVRTREVFELDRIAKWWNRQVVVRIKALIYTATVITILTVSFQVQNYQLNAARIQDVEDRQDQVCTTRIQSRKDLREILFYVVDLSDVLPDNQAAVMYTKNRKQFINNTYPELTKADCS